MYFIVSRTSDYEGKEFPCDGAFKKRVNYIDSFNYEEEKRWHPYSVDDMLKAWKSKGNNNKRLLGSETWVHEAVEARWCMRIGGLQSLSDFIKNIGEEVVLSVNEDYKGYMFLEIYDGYRE